MTAPDEYTAHYFLHRCAGHEEWSSSNGAEMAGVYWPRNMAP